MYLSFSTRAIITRGSCSSLWIVLARQSVFTFDHELSVGIGTYYILQGGGFPTLI